jgi:hypothetical protein
VNEDNEQSKKYRKRGHKNENSLRSNRRGTLGPKDVTAAITDYHLGLAGPVNEVGKESAQEKDKTAGVIFFDLGRRERAARTAAWAGGKDIRAHSAGVI